MKSLNLIALGLFLFTIGSCSFTYEKIKGEGPIVSEEREVTDFDAIEIDFSGNVYYTVSDEISVSVEAQGNLLPYIETELEGNTLVVSSKSNTNISTDKEIKIIVSGPAIHEIGINGSGTFLAQSEMTVDKMDCEIDGSGNIIFTHLITEEFNGEINGSGEIRLNSGGSNLAAYAINGSGDIEATNFQSREVDIEINGSGDIRVYAIKTLNVSISGSGDISYAGDPLVDLDKSGSGDLHKL